MVERSVERYVVMLNVVPRHECEVINNLRKAMSVRSLYSIYGEYDILAIVDDLNPIKHILRSRFIVDSKILKIDDGFIRDDTDA